MKNLILIVLALLSLMLGACQHSKARVMEGSSINCDLPENRNNPVCVYKAN